MLFSAIYFVVVAGTVQIWLLSPVLILMLFLRAVRTDGRYAIAAIVEVLLTGAHFFVAIPLVQ